MPPMSNDARSSQAETQLAAIKSLNTALERAGIDGWLFGGWAVDFWVGRITRHHSDVDIAAFRRDEEAIRAALTGAGWRHTPDPDDDLGTQFAWRGVRAEFTFVFEEDGAVLIALPEGTVVWSSEPFGDHRRELGGVVSRVLPLEVLKAGKQVPRADPANGAKDRADFDALSRVH
jgi:Aminoglycoside-2''-adenylyltransferase